MNWKKFYNSKHILPITTKSTQNFTKNANGILKDETNNKIHCLYYDTADFNKMVATYVNSLSLLHLDHGRIQALFKIVNSFQVHKNWHPNFDR